MIVWGGFDNLNFVDFNTGGKYNPNTDSWTATSTNNVPDARQTHTTVWTGSEMIVWGGILINNFSFPRAGGKYQPCNQQLDSHDRYCSRRSDGLLWEFGPETQTPSCGWTKG